ncbi:FtsX-like permease family protein [Rugosimonospora africana]|nr:FtsX-like permease family protein [Rugosimonospora africana]
MAPWWRGPILLLRRGGVVIALIAAALVATLPAAAATPFLSSSRSATLHHQIAASCPWSLGASVTGTLYGAGDGSDPSDDPAMESANLAATRTEQASAAARSIPLVGPAETTLFTPVQGPTEVADNPVFPINLVARSGAEDHLQVLDGPRGTGAWISDEYANFVHLKVGDPITLYGANKGTSRRLPDGQTEVSFSTERYSTTVPVAAVYRDLRDLPDDPWWCDLESVYDGPQGNAATPVVVFLDQKTFLTVQPRLNMPGKQVITFPLTDPNLNQDQARRTAAAVARFNTLYGAKDSPFDAIQNRVGTPNSGDILLAQFSARADLARRSMLPAVVPVTAAGVLVGLLVVAAAAVFWVQRRRRELTLLSAHGVSAKALALKAVTESLPALVVGTVAGWGAAWGLVRWVGPDPVLSREAAPWAAAGAVASLVAAVLAVAVVAGVTCRSLTDQVRSRHHRVLRAIPYELLVLAAAVPLWRALGGQQVTGDASNGVGTAIHVPGRLLIVPIMVVAGLTVLAARLAVGYLRSRGTRRRPASPAAFLSWRRIGRQAVMTAVLAGATSVPIALAVYGATVTGSVHTTVADEARLRVGSDVVMTLTHRVPIPASLADQATEVLRLDGSQIGGVETDLLGVDPASFARDAYWDSRLDGASLDDLMDPIRSGGGNPRTVVASAQTPSGAQQATWSGDKVLGGTVNIVSTHVLPAQRTGYPAALIPKAALGDDTQYAVVQLWVRGDPAQIQRAAKAANLPVKQILVAEDLYSNSLWEPLTYTFEYLTALSLLTGVVTLVGLLLYLESRTPWHRRSYVMLRRMGLTARSHRRAILGELALPLSAGLVGGIAVAAGLTAALSPNYDLNPDQLPDTVVAVPYLPVGLIAVAVVAVAIGAGGYAQRRIGRANPSEVLRDAI